MNKITAKYSPAMIWEPYSIIRLNGVVVDGVTRADEAAGEVECLVDDGRGGWKTDGDEFALQILRGTVEITLKPDAGEYAWAFYWLARLGNPHRREAGWL